MILALDISTHSGYALLDGTKENPVLVKYGTAQNIKPVAEYGDYPYSYLAAAESIAIQLFSIVLRENPAVVVVEETNRAKAVFSQKVLEWIHASFVRKMAGLSPPIALLYIRSSMWRLALGLTMSKDDKKNNLLVKKAQASGGRLSKKQLGVKGKIGKKHLAVRYVNATLSMDFKQKDNDVCDAICLGLAHMHGARICDGK